MPAHIALGQTIAIASIVGVAAYWFGWINGWARGRQEERAKWLALSTILKESKK